MKISYSGLDIGGANIKVYDGEAKIFYFPMWKKWRELEDFLRGLDITGKVGIVLTAELADCFKSKAEGVRYIADIAKRVFDDVCFIDIDGNLKREIDVPERFAANNWIASVKFLAEQFESFIFVDMGSTTTDIIPVKDKDILASKTDFERLKRRELLYFGMLRTPSFYLIKDNCSSEFFSIVADAMRIVGLIDEDAYICETPDGRGKGIHECMQRLARQFCADVSEVGEEFVINQAEKIVQEMVDRVADALKEKRASYGIDLAIGCGIGEEIIRRACKKAKLEYLSLEEKFGEVSHIFPAFAIAKILQYDSC